jgi:hypothetical protein
MLDRLDKGFKAVLAALDGPGTSSQVVIQLDTAVQEQILGVLRQVLGIVKDIRKHQVDTGADSATLEEVNAILGPVLERMKSVPNAATTDEVNSIIQPVLDKLKATGTVVPPPVEPPPVEGGRRR